MIEKIQKILKNKKSANNSTSKLYLHLLRSMKMNPKEMTAADLLNGMNKGKYPSFDTVSRLSRKIRNS